MLRAVIFDMDGLLIDSEPLWVRAEIECFGKVGLDLSQANCEKNKGLRIDDVVDHWYARSPWTGPSPREVEARIVARIAELIRSEGQALAGMREALVIAREAGRALALASSSPSPVIDAVLDRLGIRSVFNAIVSAEKEAYGKPHPGIFLSTANRLGVAPTECLVLEDSLPGLIAAKAARMACIAVPFDWPAHDARFALADAVVPSLAHVTREVIERIERQ
jgi:sugar-phosphatase